MKVKDFMTKELKGIKPDSSVKEAAGMMKKHNIGALPVIEHSKAEGFITDRDIAIRCVGEGRDPESTSVRDCMTQGVVTIYQDDNMETASRKMCDNKVRRLVVINQESHPLGILNLNDIQEDREEPELVEKTIKNFYRAS